MKLETIRFDEEKNSIVIIDQTLLPGQMSYRELLSIEDVWQAIRSLAIRGAPAIGVCAALGIYAEAVRCKEEKTADFRRRIVNAIEYLKTSRPTAVNLFWALAEMERTLNDNIHCGNISDVAACMKNTAFEIYNRDISTCRAIGEYGYELIKDCTGVLTHCNAGSLAAVDYGTALAPIYIAYEKGKTPHVYADETRPLLQGARLTAFELSKRGVSVTLLCDNMAASLMKSGAVQAVLVGCDRVAMNGDFANKIGTCGVAILAKHFGIPFYVCAPTSTIDTECICGESIIIENRLQDEVTDMWYKTRMAPKGISVLNPAFDVTEAELVTAFITEYGVVRPPYAENFLNLLKKQ